MAKHIVKEDHDDGYLIEQSGTWIFKKSSQIHGLHYGIQTDPVDNVTISFSGKVDASTTTYGSAISGWGSHFTVVIEKGGIISGATDSGLVAHETFADLQNKGSISNTGFGISSLGELSKVSNSGKISALAGIELQGGTTIATNSGIINAEIGIRATGSDYVIKNSGNIIATAGETFDGNGWGIQLEGGSTEVVNSGKIKAAIGITADGTGYTINNKGKIEASDAGIELIGGYSKALNTGTITGARGIYTDGVNNVITNGKSGKIIAEYGYSTDGIFGGIEGSHQETVIFTNHGLIRSTVAFFSAGNLTPEWPGQELYNFGTIEGRISTGNAIDEIENRGSITGNISTGAGTDSVSNRGTITGDINLGAGDDTIDLRIGKLNGDVFGGTENDTFYLDNAKIKIIELSDGGDADIIFSAVSFALPDEVENLTLTGKKNINATGNENVNTIIGNAGNNVIIGGVGGGDTMSGGKGNDRITIGGVFTDTIIFSTGDGKDVITNFNRVTDTLDLSGWTAITDLEDLTENHLKEVNGNAVIFAGKDSITLQDVSAEQASTVYFEFALA